MKYTKTLLYRVVNTDLLRTRAKNLIPWALWLVQNLTGYTGKIQ